MAWVAVDKNKDECIFEFCPIRFKSNQNYWKCQGDSNFIVLTNGTIEKILNKKLTWKDEPVEI